MSIFSDLKAATFSIVDAGCALVSVSATLVKDSSELVAITIPATKDIIVAVTDLPRQAYTGYVMEDQELTRAEADAVVAEGWDKTMVDMMEELALLTGKTIAPSKDATTTEASTSAYEEALVKTLTGS
jgi:hypothetical protein